MIKIDKEKLNKIITQLDTILEEIRLLSKKSPNDALNKFKLKYVNQTIVEANTYLNDKNMPFSDFSVFSDDDLPSNSDVVFILSQYSESLNKTIEDIGALEREIARKKR